MLARIDPSVLDAVPPPRPEKFCWCIDTKYRRFCILLLLWTSMFPPATYLMSQYVSPYFIKNSRYYVTRPPRVVTKCSEICMPPEILFDDNTFLDLCSFLFIIPHTRALFGVYTVSPQSTFYWPLIALIISFVAGVNFYLAVRIIFAIITDCDCYLMVFTFLIASFSAFYSFVAYVVYKIQTGAISIALLPRVIRMVQIRPNSPISSPEDVELDEEVDEEMDENYDEMHGEMIEMIEMVDMAPRRSPPFQHTVVTSNPIQRYDSSEEEWV